MQQRRLAQQQQEQEFNRRLHAAQLQRQYEQMTQQSAAQAAREEASNKRLELMQQTLEQRDKPPLKQGYMRDPQDPMRQTPVPGGPAWRDLSSKHAADMQTLGALDETSSATNATIDRVLAPERKGAFNSNFGGYNALATQYLPGETQDVRNDLENLKSGLKTYGLNIIRSSSGAIGTITEREWPILEKQIESLTPLMGEPEAREALKRIKARLEGMKKRALNVYKQEWGDSPFYEKDPLAKLKAAGGEGGPPSGISAEDWAILNPEEKARILQLRGKK